MEYSEQFLTERFHVMGEMFGRYLVSLAEFYKSGEAVTELVYQNLLNYFMPMFGLDCYFVPLVSVKKMEIKSVPVTSSPDMLLLQSQKIIAPIKVKQNLYIENDEQPTPQKIKKTEKSSPDTRKINHLNKNVIGQIGGEMLINLNSSAGRKNKMLGIISQETYITFVYLKCKADIKIKDNMMK